MMNGRGKSSPVIVVMKLANKAEPKSVAAAESVERRAGTKGNAASKARAGLRTGLRVPRRWCAYAMLPRQHCVWTQGGNRMRESRKYGSVRGALSNERPYRDEGASRSWRDQPVQVRPR